MRVIEYLKNRRDAEVDLVSNFQALATILIIYLIAFGVTFILFLISPWLVCFLLGVAVAIIIIDYLNWRDN